MIGSMMRRSRSAVGRARTALAAPLVLLLGGCVQVSAPTEPIVIDLNINIRQEVVLSLREDVREMIQNNPRIF